MQYIPCNSALLAQETLFMTQRGTFFAQRSQKSVQIATNLNSTSATLSTIRCNHCHRHNGRVACFHQTSCLYDITISFINVGNISVSKSRQNFGIKISTILWPHNIDNKTIISRNTLEATNIVLSFLEYS